jgi:hypothetical protein
LSGNLTLTADAQHYWFALSTDLPFPNDISSSMFLNVSCMAGGILLTGPVHLAKVPLDYVAPEGAIVFPPGNVVLSSGDSSTSAAD